MAGVLIYYNYTIFYVNIWWPGRPKKITESCYLDNPHTNCGFGRG